MLVFIARKAERLRPSKRTRLVEQGELILDVWRDRGGADWVAGNTQPTSSALGRVDVSITGGVVAMSLVFVSASLTTMMGHHGLTYRGI